MISKFIMVGWTLFILYSFFEGASAVNNEVGHSKEIANFVITLSMVGHFFGWCAVAIPTYILSRMFRT